MISMERRGWEQRKKGERERVCKKVNDMKAEKERQRALDVDEQGLNSSAGRWGRVQRFGIRNVINLPQRSFDRLLRPRVANLLQTLNPGRQWHHSTSKLPPHQTHDIPIALPDVQESREVSLEIH